MRLLFTIPDFWPDVRRGSERLVHDLSLVMSRRGHEVTVLTRTPRGRGYVIDDEGFRVEYRAAPRVLHRLLGLSPLEEFALAAATKALRDPHDVHHAFYIADAFGLVQAARRRARPVVFSWHGVPGARWWQEHEPRTHRMYRSVLARAAQVTVMTEVSAEAHRRDYGSTPMVLTPGIFVDDFARPRRPGPPAIVCAAAVDDPRKRLDILLAAFAELAVQLPELELVLAGQGDQAVVRHIVADMPATVARRVRFEPGVDLAATYAGCAVGALTSEVEAFGLVVVEYLAAGMPAVVSDDGGSAGLVTPATGAVFRRGDAGDCARALREALEISFDPATAGRCVSRARAFDWSVRGDAYEALYRSLV